MVEMSGEMRRLSAKGSKVVSQRHGVAGSNAHP